MVCINCNKIALLCSEYMCWKPHWYHNCTVVLNIYVAQCGRRFNQIITTFYIYRKSQGQDEILNNKKVNVNWREFWSWCYSGVILILYSFEYFFEKSKRPTDGDKSRLGHGIHPGQRFCRSRVQKYGKLIRKQSTFLLRFLGFNSQTETRRSNVKVTGHVPIYFFIVLVSEKSESARKKEHWGMYK